MNVLSIDEMTAAWQRRDAAYDGLFVFGVRTTGIFCRPSCPSQPNAENMQFFASAGEAVRAGYRPCKRCAPELANGRPPGWVVELMDAAAKNDGKLSARQLRELGVAPERARRWFQQNHGMTFAAWLRGLRLSRAFTQIRRGAPVDDVVFDNGYESHSGFRTAFAKAFSIAPGQSANEARILAALLETPLGPMLAAVSDSGVCQLEFADRRGLEQSYAEMRRRFKMPVVPGENSVMEQLRSELAAYFEGELKEFATPLAISGTEFQESVWDELLKIPYGETANYEEVAKRIDAPTACRAVARANGSNRIYILIPCHRVIAKDGALSGYGGGAARKKYLLALEQRSQ